MRRILFALVALTFIAVGAYAAAPAYSAVDAVYDYWIDTTLALDDTISDTDSATILSNYDITDEGEYVLARGAFTGETSDDSVNCVLRVFALDDTNGTMYYVDVDSATTIAGEAYLLSLGGEVFGSRITVKLITLTDTGDEIIMPTMYLWKRRPITLDRRR